MQFEHPGASPAIKRLQIMPGIIAGLFEKPFADGLQH
jgi:hypothetical protein